MKIVVLDGYTLNPGDLSWDELRSIGESEIHDRTPAKYVIERAAHAEILLTNKVEVRREHLKQLERLKYIGVLATGTNVVDVQAARQAGIVVTNVPAYGIKSVAQATIALLLELTNNAGRHEQSVREGNWSRKADWCYWERPQLELDGLTMGIVGLGRIGRAVGQIAAALGMRVIAYTPRPKDGGSFIERVDLETLIRRSDVVTLHCPLTDETRNLINEQRLSWMKPTAILLNTSRGALLDEQAVAAALNSGRLAGAGLDVLSVEPPPVQNPLLGAKNCVVTPHIAWATRAARERLMKIAVENIRSFLGGKPQNVVN